MSLPAGCLLLRLTPLPRARPPLAEPLDGTLRVERDGVQVVASGDLYARGPSEPDPAAGVPSFPRAAYRFYARATAAAASAAADGTVALALELHAFDAGGQTWSSAGAVSGRLAPGPAPAGHPPGRGFLAGEVRDAGGAAVGELTLGWVAPHLRSAVVELDRVAAAEPALANAAGIGWRALFAAAGWNLAAVESDADVPEPSGASWSVPELRAALAERRVHTDLDAEWRYWLLAVRRLDDEERGLMFDRDEGDANRVPREGAALASHWPIPDEERWGLVRGMRFGTATDVYFRTAVHEIGHAMGLLHNPARDGLMTPTDALAASAAPPRRFPENIVWSFAPGDARRLRHLPDHWVRPGGVPFGRSYGTAPPLPEPFALEP